MLPGPHADKRVCQLASESTYERLVDGGVNIWAFQPSMLHAKVMTVDGLVAVLGSANMNRRSLNHDEEVILSVLDRDVAGRLAQDFDEDLLRCERIDPARWGSRPLHQKAQEQAVTVLKRWF